MVEMLTAHEQQVLKVFSNDYIFEIPGYQRPYSWTKDHARDLFDDLISFMDSDSGNVGDTPPYFLGSIVLIKQAGCAKAEVIDGQQRLTTLTILLSAIRANVDPEYVATLTGMIYEQGSPITGAKDHFRLNPRERDREFFQEFIQREGGIDRLIDSKAVLTDPQKLIQGNAGYFLERVRAMPHPQRLRLAQFIVTRCFLVVVSTPDIDSAYRIFSVMNSRGLDLTATDILKSHILGGIPEYKRSAYTTKWEDAEQNAGREGFQELFSHIRMIYRKAKPKGTLLKEFQDHVVGTNAPLTLMDDILLPYVEAYSELKNNAYAVTEGSELVNETLEWLNRLEFTDWLPPALAFTIREREKPAEMARFFADLERLAYSQLIIKTWANGRIERFSELTRAIENGDDLYESNSPLQLTAQEKADVYKVLSGPFYDTLSARARSTILVRLDALLSEGEARYDHAIITVEHVLPQNPADKSKWLEWFPDPIERNSVVHQIGNLTLLTRKKNSAASNREFGAKKASYFTHNGATPFPLTTQVLQYAEWRPEVIVERQQILLNKLVQHWRLEGRAT